MVDKATLGKLIELAYKMEKHSYAFYEELEKKYPERDGLIECLHTIKKDELLHQRILEEIRESLSETRLMSPVPQKIVEKITEVWLFITDLDFDSLDTSDKIVEAIQKLESVEFDVVLEFVDIQEIKFDFTREYLDNQSSEHVERVYKLQQCIE